MYIRKLKLNDIVEHQEDIYKLLIICFKNTYKLEISNDVIDKKYIGLINYIESGRAYIFGAIDDEALIGFLWGYPVHTPVETVFHVAYISVVETKRRLGIGQKLMNEAEKLCKELGLNQMELIVGAENSSALSFYKQSGYIIDRYCLRKDLE